MTTWGEALDLYEAGLEHHRHLIEQEILEGSNPWPPEELPEGPMPEELQERAEELLQRANGLMDEMGRKLAGLPTPRPIRYGRHATPHQPRWSARL